MQPAVSYLRCGLTGHDDTYLFMPLLDDALPPTMTIALFLRLMAEDHAQTCGCSVRVGSEAWFLNKSVATFQPTSHPLPLDCTLGDITSALDWAAVHLIVMGHPRVRSLLSVHPPGFLPHCEVIEHNDAAVFKLAGSELVLPDATCVDYASMSSIKGLIMLDKTRFVLPQFSQPDPDRLALFRRPAGFGKTTLLSILTTYFDVLCPPAYYSSRDSDTIPPHLDYLDAAAHMMILHMDFADLRFDNTMSLEAKYDECDRFLALVGANFVGRYSNILGDAVPATLDGRDYLAAIALAHNAGYQVFLAIDNYTAPFKHAYTAWEGVVSVHIIDPILQDFARGRIQRGILLGTDSEYSPFAGWDRFQRSTVDLTHGIELAAACGLTSDEVQALGAATGIDNLLSDVHHASADTATHETPTVVGNTQPIFCTRDVLALARQRLDPEKRPTSSSVTVAVINVPVHSVLDSDESDHGDSDDTLVDDEIELSLKGSFPAQACASSSPPRKVAVVQVAQDWLGDDDDMGYEPFDMAGYEPFDDDWS